jgi:DNA-binding NarL/FixJ family response regulator
MTQGDRPVFRLLICDDHAATRIGVRFTANSAVPDCDVTEAATAGELMGILHSGRPFDLLILDVQLPDRTGISVLPEIRELRPELRIWITSGELSEDVMASGLNAGANGYLPKSVSEKVLFQALRDASLDRIVLPGNYRDDDAAWDPQQAGHAAGQRLQSLGLTPRQRDVLHCILQGYSAKQIARELRITDGTVKTHTAAIFNALGVNSRANVIVKCNRMGIPLSAR